MTHVKYMYVSISLALVWVLELCVSDQDGVHVGRGVLVEFVTASYHDNCNLNIAKDA